MTLETAKAWMKARGISEPRVRIGQAVQRYQQNLPTRDMGVLQEALLKKS